MLDGLLLWKRNIDRHIEGVEECCICMMTVHNGNYQLPKVCCRQCKKRFHGACLVGYYFFLPVYHSIFSTNGSNRAVNRRVHCVEHHFNRRVLCIEHHFILHILVVIFIVNKH